MVHAHRALLRAQLEVEDGPPLKRMNVPAVWLPGGIVHNLFDMFFRCQRYGHPFWSLPHVVCSCFCVKVW